MGADWLFDMEEYNEFMCEEDYEVDEAGDPQPNDMNMDFEEYSACEEKPKKAKGSKKRGRSPSPPPAQTPKGGRKAKGAAGGGRSVTKKARTAAMAKDDIDDDDDDLTADMDDPAPENPISEVKLTAANAGRADMQPSKPGTGCSVNV